MLNHLDNPSHITLEGAAPSTAVTWPLNDIRVICLAMAKHKWSTTKSIESTKQISRGQSSTRQRTWPASVAGIQPVCLFVVPLPFVSIWRATDNIFVKHPHNSFSVMHGASKQIIHLLISYTHTNTALCAQARWATVACVLAVVCVWWCVHKCWCQVMFIFRAQTLNYIRVCVWYRVAVGNVIVCRPFQCLDPSHSLGWYWND